jgi:hypothetical protein
MRSFRICSRHQIFCGEKIKEDATETRNAYNNLIGESEGKRPLWRITLKRIIRKQNLSCGLNAFGSR